MLETRKEILETRRFAKELDESIEKHFPPGFRLPTPDEWEKLNCPEQYKLRKEKEKIILWVEISFLALMALLIFIIPFLGWKVCGEIGGGIALIITLFALVQIFNFMDRVLKIIWEAYERKRC